MTLFYEDPNQQELDIIGDIDPTSGYRDVPFTAGSIAIVATAERTDQLQLTLQ